jgi:hypothetical protein
MPRTDYCPELQLVRTREEVPPYDDLVHFLFPRMLLHVVSAALYPHCRLSFTHGQSVTPLGMYG